MNEYLGDSVYVNTDGYYIILTTGQGDNVASNTIYLEPEVFAALSTWVDQNRNRSNEADERNPPGSVQ